MAMELDCDQLDMARAWAAEGDCDMLELAKSALAEGDCTLVVANGGEARKFLRRGVGDLLWLLDNEPEALQGACVADKVIGKAAASLMIVGGVMRAYGRVMTREAAVLLSERGVGAEYGALVDMVENRTKTGRCPLDTICSRLHDPEEMRTAIGDFLNGKLD